MENASSRPRLADLILLLGRLLLSLIFLHEGWSLAADITATIDTFAKLGLSAPVALATIALQIGAGLSVATGLLSRLGALALALFCLATALLFHTNFASQNELLHFEKDLAIAGGMFVVPLYAFLTTTVPKSETARTVAANNIVNSGAMVVATLMLTGLVLVGVSVAETLFLVALGSIVAAWLGWKLHLACD